MHRSQFLAALSAAATIPAGASLAADAAAVAGVTVPGSDFAREATLIAKSAESPEVFAHSLRTFYFAELVAKANGIQHDTEAVYVACILHDTGLSPQHMSDKRRFEVDSAFLALDLCKKHQVAPYRMGLIWDAIALHDQGDIARFKQPEVALVNAGVGADFGAYLNLLARSEISAVLAAAPREKFVPVFLNTVAAYVKRKPLCTGNSWITDIGNRMVPGFHLDNFVDEVAEDPFEGY